jgi:hypothetical protein
LLSSFLEVVCDVISTRWLKDVGPLFFGVCGVLLAFVKAVASMKAQIYEMPPRFTREFVRLRLREVVVEGTWVGGTIS